MLILVVLLSPAEPGNGDAKASHLVSVPMSSAGEQPAVVMQLAQASEVGCIIGFAVQTTGSQLPAVVPVGLLAEPAVAGPAAEESAVVVASGDIADNEEDEDDTVCQLSVCQSPEAVSSRLKMKRAAAAPATEELVANSELLHSGSHCEGFSAAAAVPAGSKNRSARKRRQNAREDGESALHFADGEECSCRWEPPPA